MWAGIPPATKSHTRGVNLSSGFLSSGMMGGPPLTSTTGFADWAWSPIADVLMVVALVGYLGAVRRVRRNGERWPIRRIVLFVAGIAVLAITLDSSIAHYSALLFWMHMIEHLLLIMVVPALLVLGHPLQLISLTGPRGERIVAAVCRNPVVVVLTHPVIGFALYVAVLVGTHLTGFMQGMAVHGWLHPVEDLLYVVAGYLFLQPLLAHEPIRWNPPYPARMGLLLFSMVVDAFIGIILMISDYEPFPAMAAMRSGWGPSALSDLHTGGAIMWVGGDGLMMIAAIVLAGQWISDTEHQNDLGNFLESARRTALAGLTATDAPWDAADASVDVDDDDEVLRAYNLMLKKLDQQGSSPDL
jgi:putative copper resistance protein D